MANFKGIYQKLERIERFLLDTAPVIIGVEAVNHFKESFEKQGFTDETLEKWEDVERRKPGSPWYGFKYQSKVARPGRGRRRQDSTTNYSPAASKRPILSGDTQELMNSIRYTRLSGGARIIAGTAYAKVINEGGQIKVFGKKTATMPKRQFMGKSTVLERRLQAELIKELRRIV